MTKNYLLVACMVSGLIAACGTEEPRPGMTGTTSGARLAPGESAVIECTAAPVCPAPVVCPAPIVCPAVPPPVVCLPACGDKSCNGTESCATCPGDCGVCPPPAPSCGDKSCNGTETCSLCPGDCGVCPPPPVPLAVLDADAQVSAAAPTTNYGTGTYLTADLDPVVESYLRFNVTGLTAPAGRAVLRLTVTDASVDGPAVYAVPNTWVEGTVTYATKPVHGTTLIADVGAVEIGQVIEYDVTALVKANGLVSFALVGTSTSGAGFSSKQGTAPPVLLISTTIPVVPAPTTSFTFSSIGDIGNDANATAVLKSAPANGEFIMMVGDLSYQAPPETTWCNYVKTNLGALRTVIVTGNHESISTYGNGLIDNFIAANCLPNTLPNVKGVYGKEFYFDYPANAPIARFIMTSPGLPFENPPEVHVATKGSAHYLWTANAIDQARAAGIKWIIVGTHRPCLTVGEKTCEMGVDYMNLLVEKKVDLVLMGHDHTYSRSKQLSLGTGCTALVSNVFNQACVVDDGADNLYTRGRGPVFIVNGMGGRAVYAGNPADPEVPFMANYMTTANATWGVNKITVTMDKINVEFIKAVGSTFVDKFTVGTPPPVATTVPMVPNAVTASTENFPNPERGFYVGLNLLTGGASAVNIRAAGTSTVIGLVRLDNFRDKPLDQATLDGLNVGFRYARLAGLKVILRFMYNSAQTPDAPLDIILGHIAQLKPVVQANADVIAVWQGGFIGGWGEWHGSTNGLDNPTSRKAIVDAMLDALPASRTVQIRTPQLNDALYPGVLTLAEAWKGTPKSRLGHHNDCFLASDTDMGTYPGSAIQTWKDYLAAEGQYTPVGGETCAVFSPRTDCVAATAEMRANHWSYLNSQYNALVLDPWKTQGCYSQVQKDLGYRFTVTRVMRSETVAPGGILEVETDIVNSGYAALFNARPVYMVLASGTAKYTVLVHPDARTWGAGATIRMVTKLRVPAGAPPGMYSLSLWMPDSYDSIKNDPKFAVRMANANMWDATTGMNVLAGMVPVDANSPGPVDASATAMVVVP